MKSIHKNDFYDSIKPMLIILSTMTKTIFASEGWDREGGREMQEGGDIGIYVYV